MLKICSIFSYIFFSYLECMKHAHTITLQRQITSSHGTEGILSLPHLGVKFFTLELPWRDNISSLSCIPHGIYTVNIRQSPRYGRIYHVKNVPERSWILIHWGNLAGDCTKGFKSNVEGCILLGKRRGTLSGQKAVLVSRPAVREFMQCMNNEKFILKIEGV